jgi:hypothetical protein
MVRIQVETDFACAMPPSAALLVMQLISGDPVDPRPECGSSPKAADAEKDLQKNVVRQILARRVVITKP